MLRKHTSFFDSSLEHLDDGNLEEKGLLSAYENALKLCDRFVDLIRDISFIPCQLRKNHRSEDEYIQEIRSRLEALSDDTYGSSGYGEGDEAIKFEEVARKVYRLETVLRFPWESDWNGNTKKRELYLDINFFEKGAKQPYYKIQFWFTNSNSVYDEYWGEWPKKKESDSETNP